MNVLVTGASGFIGQHLCGHLTRKNINTYALLRTFTSGLSVKDQFIIEDFSKHSDWGAILTGMDVIIHTAGLAHVTGCPEEDYYETNTAVTKKLALECAKYNVRFVFISSMAVYGKTSYLGIITSSTPTNPTTPYGKSKLLAEEFLQNLQAKKSLEIVIVRPPLVYGPSAPGNVRMLVDALKKRIPLPFSRTQNQRDMIYIENLADALRVCATHPAAKGNTFFVSDNQPLSIGDLIQGFARGLARKALLFYLPEALMRIAFRLLKKEEALEKIIGSFLVDTSTIQNVLGWTPPIPAAEGLEKTGRSFR